MRIEEVAAKLMQKGFICDHCLGRCFAQLLSGLTNQERGNIVRHFLAFLLDSGEKIRVDNSNFYGIKFRNVRLEAKKPTQCYVCKNLFLKLNAIAKKAMQKLKGVEFETFLVGSIVPNDVLTMEEKVWEETGIEFVESVKSEVNRELGRRIESLAKKKFRQRNPDITLIVNLQRESVKVEVRSLYVFGRYQKLARGFPQSKWICPVCRGKGCPHCDGKGKLYRTSVQELIERPLLKATGSKRSKFSGLGREDVDARCLGWRPFVLEMLNPRKRQINLRKIKREINRSKLVQVKGLKWVDKSVVRKVKSARADKTYLAIVDFQENIDKAKLAKLKVLEGAIISQRTPLRVLHRRADKVRRRIVKSLKVKVLGKKRLQVRVRAQAGLYVKEFIDGDYGRTSPSIAELLGNPPKRITLDVVQIHEGFGW